MSKMILWLPVCSLLGETGPNGSLSGKRLLTPDLNIENKICFYLLKQLWLVSVTMLLRGCDSDRPPSRVCLAGMCLSSCRKWSDLEAAAPRPRREETSCSRFKFRNLLGQPPATFQHPPPPTLFPWAESKRPWTLTLLTRRPPPGLLQALLSLDSSRRVSTCSRQRRWLTCRASFRRNESARLKRSVDQICLPDTEAVFLCCAFYRAAVFCKVTSSFPDICSDATKCRLSLQKQRINSRKQLVLHRLYARPTLYFPD